MLSKIIADNYALNIDEFQLLDSHFSTEIYLLKTPQGKYIVKSLPLQYGDGVETESAVTDYLLANGLNVPRILRTRDGSGCVKTSDVHFHIQEFVEGETLPLNTAPDWFLEQSADILGRVHRVLKDYGELPTNFGANFFAKANALTARDYYSSQLQSAQGEPARELAARVRHLERIAEFDVDAARLTYSNSHGDYWNNQIIVKDKELTVIDWTSASKVPVCLEVILSYVTESPESRSGAINRDGLKRYIEGYSKHFPLSAYDLQAMPYVLYFQQLMCHYPPPYGDVAESYQPICGLINNFTDWLYDNAEKLSTDLLR